MNVEFFELDRRVLLQRLAFLLGTTTIPAEALRAAKTDKAKRFLNVYRLQLLSAVADTIVPATDTPGAVAAGVPATLDAMLSTWASATSKKSIVEALDRIDAAAKAAKNTGFAVLSVVDRDAVLRPHDKAALVKANPPANAPKANPFFGTPWVADQGYFIIKDLVIALYYNSELAMTKELVYEHNPGPWQPSIQATDRTRPWASVTLF